MEDSLQFIVLAPNAWKGQWMNRQQLFSRIGKKHEVVYSTGPLMSWETKTPAFSNASIFGRVEASDNVKVYYPSKFLLRVTKLSWLDRLVKKLFCRGLNSDLTPGKKKCLYVFHPKFEDYRQDVHSEVLVYHAYDDFSKQGGNVEELEEKEKRLLDKADFVFASSRSIQQRLQNLSKRDDIQFIPNGVDFEMFSSSGPEPDDLSAIKKPRVGYTGSINRKVDLHLLCKLADKFKDIQFVMIGSIGDLSNQEDAFQKLKTVENVHFLGFKAGDEIASYMQHMDINIMLYRTDKLTWASSGYPLKLHEYLATGQPVIGADIEAIREFSKVVDIPKNEEEWIESIKRYTENEDTVASQDERRVVAKNNTWDSRVRVILEHVSG